MKSISKMFLIMLLGSVVLFSSAYADNNASKEVKIQTNAHCGSCKSKIENGLKNLDGVMKSEVNMDNKVLTVSYNPEKVNENAITKSVSDLGYKADVITADMKSTTSDKHDCSGEMTSKKCGDDEKCCKDKSKATKTHKIKTEPQAK